MSKQVDFFSSDYKKINLKVVVKVGREFSRFSKDRERIIDELEDRVYLVSLRCNCCPECMSYIDVEVHPDKKYGGVNGRELIRKHLSRYWKKGKNPDNPAIRQARYRDNEKRYGHRSLADIEKLTKLGNVKDDKSFQKHLDKMEKMNAVQKKDYLSHLRKKEKKRTYQLGNEAKSWWHETEDEKRKREQKKIEQSEDEELLDAIVESYEEND